MDSEHKIVDLVFVVGPIEPKPKKAIFRFIRRVTRSWNDCQVASIHFTTQYDSKLCKSVFCSRTVDFTNSYPVTINEVPQVEGNPLQHVSNLSFRENAIKICFLITNILPFYDSYGENNAGWEDNDNGHAKIDHEITEEIYHEDPLLTCHYLAAMGVTLYCIETNQHTTIYRDMYTAFSYITGGQFILIDKTKSLQKALRSIVLEEISLDKLIGQVRDDLCVSWYKWGRKKSRKPLCMEDLTDNILNHLHKVNVMTHEVLLGMNSPQQPSTLVKKIAASYDVSEARNISECQDSWSANLNWIPQACDEVIPGYNAAKNQIAQVSISHCKLVSRNQVSRLLVRTLARRPELKKQQQQSYMTTVDNNNNDKYSNKDLHVVSQNNRSIGTSLDFLSSAYALENVNKTSDNNQEKVSETMKENSAQNELIFINSNQVALLSKNVQEDNNKEQICNIV